MAVNIAARRGAKNQRRKAVVAEKRKAEIEAGSLAGQVRLTLGYPIQHCLLSEGLFESGMGVLVVARGATSSSVSAAIFLLDTLALGVKDAYFRSLSGREFAEHMEYMSFASPLMPVDPGYARKLVHDLVAWARTLGIPPHRDHAKIEPIFGATAAAQCDAEFKFGLDGRPMLIGDLSDGVPHRLSAAASSSI